MINRLLFVLIATVPFSMSAEEVYYICEEECDLVAEADVDERPWFRRQEMMYYGADEDPTEELREDTAWPGEREEFSDRLFNY